jgi:hypothetical protein
MKVLTLSIKQKFFDQILAGTKKVETREITPKNSNRYGVYTAGGKQYSKYSDIPKSIKQDESIEITFDLIKYDALKLLTGEYKDKRPYLIVEVKDTRMFFEEDESGEPIEYEVDGEAYTVTTVDYHLGKIIEVELYKQLEY